MRKKTFKEVEEEVLNLGKNKYKVFPPYINSKEKIKFLHVTCGHYFYMRFNSFKNGQRCPLCGAKHSNKLRSKSQDEFINDVNNFYGINEYSVLGKYINANVPIKVRHNKCGNIYMSRPADLIRGHGCQKCAYITRSSKIGISQRTPLSEVKDSIRKILGNSYVVLTKDSEYKGNRQKILIKHLACGSIYKARYSDIQSKFTGCPVCSNKKSSKGERIIIECLEEKGYSLGKDYYYGYTNSGAKAKLNLHFDFYFPNNSLAIEYDGKQHFKPINYFGGLETFKVIQEHDRIKDDFCKSKGITLLRIPYLKCTKESIGKELDKSLSGLSK